MKQYSANLFDIEDLIFEIVSTIQIFERKGDIVYIRWSYLVQNYINK